MKNFQPISIFLVAILMVGLAPYIIHIEPPTQQKVVLIGTNNAPKLYNALRALGYTTTISSTKQTTYETLNLYMTTSDPILKSILKQNLRETFYEILNPQDIWELVKATRGEAISKTTITKLSSLGITDVTPTIAKTIIMTLDTSADKDPQVIKTKWGFYINFKNQPWKMEHWLTTLDRFDKNYNKLSDELENIILNAQPTDYIEVNVAPTKGNRERAIETFEALGGKVMYAWNTLEGFWGYIPANKISLLATYDYIGYIEYHHTDFKLYLKVSIPQLRVGTNDGKYITIASYTYYNSTPWGMGFRGDPNSTVVVVDTGIDDSHPELYGFQDQGWGNAKIVYWYDISGTYTTSPGDGYGHGSHCAGIVAAYGVSTDPWGAYAHAGMAPDVSLGGIKIFDDSGSFVDSNYQFADLLLNNRDAYHFIVASHSWGGGDDATLDELINNLVTNGIVQVIAAGNSGANENIGSPGSADLGITVGAINDLNEMAAYSTSDDTTTGNTVKPDVTANGGSYWGVDHTFDSTDYDSDGYIGKVDSVDSNDADNVAGTDNYWEIPGTSMATPHVSGLAALIIDALGGWANWNKTLDEALFVKMIISMTATEFTRAEAPGQSFGFGWSAWTGTYEPTLDRGGKDTREGYGRINGDAAIMAITNRIEFGKVYGYTLGTSSTSDADQAFAPRAWAGNVYLEAGKTYRLYLDVPSTADFDLYLYSGTPDEYGQPVIAASSTSSTFGGDEIIEFTPTTSGKYFIVIKWVDRALDGISWSSNYGAFKFVISEKKNLGIHHYGIPGSSLTYYGIYNNSASNTKVFVRVHNNDASLNGDVAIKIYNETSGVPLALSINNYGTGAPELGILGISGPVHITATSDSTLSGYYIDLAPVAGQLTYPGQVSYTIPDGSAFVVVLDSLVVGGNYRIRVTPSSTQDIAFDLIGSDGYTLSQVNTNTAGTAEALDLSPSSSGPYYLLVYSVSGAGSVTVELLDVGPPTASITSPQNNYNTSASTITLYWTSSDVETSISEHQIYVNGNLYASGIAGTATSYDISFSTEGTYTIELRAIDEGGNVASDSITINVDWTAPTVNILSPSDGATINTADVTITWEGSDNLVGIQYYEVSLDGTTWTNVGKSTSYTFTGLSDGTYTAYVRAVDYAGNVGTQSITFTVSTFEIISPTEDPSSGSAYTGSGSVVVSWSENTAVDHYEIYVNGTLYGSTTGLNYEIDGLGEGVWNITVVAVFSDGSSSYDSVIVINDLSPPTVDASESVLLVDSSVTSVSISWSGSDSVSGIDHYEVYVGGSWTNVGTSTSYTIDTSSLSEGIYAVYIRAFDKAGYYSQDIVLLIVDRSAPSLSLNYPVNGSIIGNSIIVSWSATDNIGVVYYEVSTDGTTWTRVGMRTSYALSFSSSGTHYFWIRAYDSSGNYATIVVELIVDLNAPTVTIDSPSDGASVTSDFTVSWSGSDDVGIEYYMVRLDGGAWIDVGTSTSYTFYGVGDGIHIVYVAAVDYSGKVSVASIMVIVSSTTTLSVDKPTDVSITTIINEVQEEERTISVVPQGDENSADRIAPKSYDDESKTTVSVVVYCSGFSISVKSNIVSFEGAEVRVPTFLSGASSIVAPEITLMNSICLIRPPN